MINKVIQAWVVITSRCQNRCKWCYAENYIKNSPREFTQHQLDHLFLFLRAIKCKRVVFIGGEPTLAKYLFHGISLAKANSIKVSITTNGIALSKIEYIKKINKYKEIIELVVSLESNDERIHDEITQNIGSHQCTIKGIENCLKNHFKITTNTTICQQNKSTCHEVIFLCKDLGINRATFNICNPPFNVECDRNNYIQLNDLNGLIYKCINTAIKNNIDINFSTPLPLCILDKEVRSYFLKNTQNSCHMMLGNGIVIDFDGQILPCTHLVDLPVANINEFQGEIEFFDFWNYPQEEAFRKKIRRHPSKKCIECQLKHDCNGGCPILWTYNNHDKIINPIYEN